jgi:hypothetical protein
LQRTFPLDVLMVPSSVFTVAADSEHRSCGGFSLDETIRFGSLEIIANYVGGLSLSPRRDGSDANIMVSNHRRPSSPLRAIIGDCLEEFHKAMGGEGGSDLPLLEGTTPGLCPTLPQSYHG